MALDIYVDKNVYLAESFASFGNLHLYEEGELFECLKSTSDRSAFVVRTTTKINKLFLSRAKASIEWVASPTAGFDHVDVDLLKALDIAFFHSPGCNSTSVSEYILSALGYYYRDLETFRRQTFFVCGAGNVGTKIIRALRRLGAEVLVCDPPLASRSDERFQYVSMQDAKKADVLIFCVSLNKEGLYKTKHFLDDNFFSALGKKPLFINTSRGEIVETKVLLKFLEKGIIKDIVVDVYENEPNLCEDELKLIQKACIATPHIAGYAFESKKRATEMIFNQLNAFYGLNEVFPSSSSPLREESTFFTKPFSEVNNFIPSIFHHLFDIEKASKNYKASLADFFGKLLSNEDKKSVWGIFKKTRPLFHLRRNNAFLLENDFKHIFEARTEEEQRLLKNISDNT